MKSFQVIIIFTVVFLVGAYNAQASLNLSVNPVEGGNALNFGRLDATVQSNRSVRIRVTSDEGSQYQVYQRFEDALVNQENALAGPGAVSTYAVSGSNATGSLYSQSSELLGQTDQLIYSSSQDGQGDAFTVSYVVDPAALSTSGSFVGRIAYSVRSLTGSQDRAVVNVYLEASGGFKISVEGLGSPGHVVIRSSENRTIEDGIRVRFDEHAADEIRVYREMDVIPQKEDGEEILSGALSFSVSSSGQEGPQAASEAKPGIRQLLYRTREKSGELIVLCSLSRQTNNTIKAGVYHGRMRVVVESGAEAFDFPLDLEVGIDPVFDIDVELPPGGVRFNGVLPFGPPQDNEVLVRVRTNLGKPYVVMQNLTSALVDADGDKIGEEYFAMKVEKTAGTPGRVAAGDFVAAGIGERPVFYSDSEGTPAQFRVIYRLRSYPEIKAGEYGAPIVYSLAEM